MLVDVRAPSEWEDGHVDGSLHCYLPDLAGGPPPGWPTDRHVITACASGLRATIAAGPLRRHGVRAVALGEGGVVELRRRLPG
ncbi:MAG: rhodanese-like domain-containing protein [Actinomycetota bacterium]|nr:rhodanese-like domain-containing protein [Actinomycetota bacterium]